MSNKFEEIVLEKLKGIDILNEKIDGLKENVKEYYTKEVNFDKLLENGNYFSNTKQLLLKEETGQLSFFNW